MSQEVRCERCNRPMLPPVKDDKVHLRLTEQERAHLCHDHGYRLVSGEWVGWAL